MIQDLLSSSETHWTEVQINRGDILSRAGEVEKYLYYVQSGALRAYTIDEDKEFTLRFAYQGSIFTSLSSFFSGEAGEMYIEALRSSVVLKCHKNDLDKFISASKERLQAYRFLLEELVIGCIERENDLLTQDPKARLDRVLKRSPQLFQEIPHKYIAAYLRMSPETLSRLLNS
jgi:CRP-like cAMP-binding protein